MKNIKRPVLNAPVKTNESSNSPESFEEYGKRILKEWAEEEPDVWFAIANIPLGPEDIRGPDDTLQ